MITKYLKLITLTISTALIISCASTHTLIGTKRPPIDPSQVKLYSKPPSKYEDVALVSASSKNSWSFTDQGKMEKVIERLKEEAASLGANGVLLQGVGDQSGGMVGTGYGTATAYSTGNTVNAYGSGTTMYVPVNHKSGQGMAIFVIQE